MTSELMNLIKYIDEKMKEAHENKDRQTYGIVTDAYCNAKVMTYYEIKEKLTEIIENIKGENKNRKVNGDGGMKEENNQAEFENELNEFYKYTKEEICKQIYIRFSKELSERNEILKESLKGLSGEEVRNGIKKSIVCRISENVEADALLSKIIREVMKE